MRNSLCALSLAGALVVVAAPLAFAAEPQNSGVVRLAAQSSAPAAAPQPAEERPVRFVLAPHPSIRIGDQIRVDFRARVVKDVSRSDTAFTEPLDQEGRRRIGVEGELFKVAFGISRELSDVEPWREAFVDVQQFTFARVQYGLFKLPLSVDENIGTTNNDFTSRSLVANHLAPGRARGVMFHGQVLDHLIGYEIGRFDDDGHNAFSSNPERVTGGKTTAWRVTSQPLERFKGIRARWRSLEVGYATTSSDLAEGFSSIKGKTALGADFYDSEFLVLGARKRQSYEFWYRPGPFSVRAEFIKMTEERLGESVEDTDLSPLIAKGWYVSGTWAVTGERKSEGLTEPAHPFLQGGIGAVEVALRLEELKFGSEAGFAAPSETGSTSPRADVVLGNRDRALTLGVNWYANRYFKLQFNMIKEQLDDPDQGPVPDRPSFWSRILRLQFSL